MLPAAAGSHDPAARGGAVRCSSGVPPAPGAAATHWRQFMLPDHHARGPCYRIGADALPLWLAHRQLIEAMDAAVRLDYSMSDPDSERASAWAASNLAKIA